jgi:subtilisin family serine protease
MKASARLRICFVLAASLLIAPVTWAECLEDDDRVEVCDQQVCVGQIFVELFPGVPVESIAGPLGLSVLDVIPQLRFYLLGFEVAAGQDVGYVVDGLVHQLEQMPTMVERAEAHRHLETPEGVQLSIPDLGDETQQQFQDQPASSTVQVDLAHERHTGQGITIAVIDTGMAFEHPQTRDRIMRPGADFAGGDGTGVSQPNNTDDDNDSEVDESLHHSTFIAGLIHLVAPDARILPIRALETDGKGTAFGVAKAIFHAIDAKVDVINLSHGMVYDSRAVKKAIDDAIEAGIVVVVAAGNRGEHLVGGGVDEDCMSYPASYEEVIAVAAVAQTLAKTAFSDYGPGIDVSAPGIDLLSTYGDADFALWSGTSFSAPFVSGAVALILEKYPCLSPEDVRTLLMQTAQPDNNSDLAGLMGAGVVDLDALTQALTAERCSLRLEETGTGTVATWSPVAEAGSYDLVRGDVGNLLLQVVEGEEGTVGLGPLLCLINDSIETDSVALPDGMVPAAGQTYFYLFRDDTDLNYGVDSDEHSRSSGAGDCAGGP